VRKNALLLLLVIALPAPAAEYAVGIGVDCSFIGVCFDPSLLTVSVGDSVKFYIYGDAGDTGLPHNVVADDGSFRCAMGCDGEGGDGTPRNYTTQWSFVRTFATPGIVSYHDEVSQAAGVIVGATETRIGRGGLPTGPRDKPRDRRPNHQEDSRWVEGRTGGNRFAIAHSCECRHTPAHDESPCAGGLRFAPSDEYFADPELFRGGQTRDARASHVVKRMLKLATKQADRRRDNKPCTAPRSS